MVYLSQHATQRQEAPRPLRHASPVHALPAPLSPHWAFVVQLREGTALTPGGMRGRVEHIVSGQATLFTSLGEVRAFMERVLAAQRRGRTKQRDATKVRWAVFFRCGYTLSKVLKNQ